jgi:AraC-like DNA-binding protein
MSNVVLDEPRGILNPRAGARVFSVERPLPTAPDLAAFVEHYWTVRWDLRGRPPYLQETLPHPSVHLVLDPPQSWIFGVVTARFARRLEGAGQAFGVKFRPAGFFPFARRPVCDFTDRTVPISEVFAGPADHRPARGEDDAIALERAVLAEGDTAAQVGLVEAFLRAHLPPPDPTVALLAGVVDLARDDREITRVDELAERAGVNARTLQRQFRRYVGVSPKWVIRRFRLHEAADRIASGEAVDQGMLAQELGYFDQAHFIKDFTALIGRSPGSYAAACSAEGGGSRRQSTK